MKENNKYETYTNKIKVQADTLLVCIHNTLKSFYTVLAALNFLKEEHDHLIIIHMHDNRLTKMQEIENKNLKDSYFKLIKEHATNLNKDTSRIKFVSVAKDKKNDLFGQIKKVLENNSELVKFRPTYRFIEYTDESNTNSLIPTPNYEKNIKYDYLINRSHIPCIIIKNKVSRKTNEDKNIKWLVFLKSADNISFYVLIKLMSFIDKDVDEIYGFHISNEVTIKNIEKDAKKKDSESLGNYKSFIITIKI